MDSACEVVAKRFGGRITLEVRFSVAGGRATGSSQKVPLKSRAGHTSPVRHQTGANFAGILTGRCVAASSVD